MIDEKNIKQKKEQAIPNSWNNKENLENDSKNTNNFLKKQKYTCKYIVHLSEIAKF